MDEGEEIERDEVCAHVKGPRNCLLLFIVYFDIESLQLSN